MDSQTKQNELMHYCNALPPDVVTALGDKNLGIFIEVNNIAASHGLALYETAHICAGVQQILEGKESAKDLVEFISKDESIEDDNREKIPDIAYELQTKVFDVAFPVWKQFKMHIKEGKVPQPPAKPIPSATTPEPQLETPQVQSTPLDKTMGTPISEPAPAGQTASLEANHVRALTRIASGTKYPEQKLREAFEDLPKGLQSAIASVDTANAVQEIAKKNFLHVDQMANLASETGLVLLGLTHPAEFVANLSKRLRVPEDKAKEVAKEISSKILSKVRDALRVLHDEGPKPQAQKPPQVFHSGPINTTTPMSVTPTRVTPSMPQAKHSILSAQVDSNKPSASDLAKKAGLNTPYSPSASWKVPGGKDAVKPVTKGETAPSREEVLRGIENPREIVGPTGWKPQNNKQTPRDNNQIQSSSSVNIQTPGSNRQPLLNSRQATNNPASSVDKQQRVGMKPPPPPPSKPVVPTPPPIPPPPPPVTTRPPSPPPRPGTPLSQPAVKTKPASEPHSPAPISTPPAKKEEDTFLEQKLQGHMSLPKEEKKYSSDPYREPIE